MHPKLAALSGRAREQVDRALSRIREALDGEEYGVSTAEYHRVNAMEKVLSLAAPGLRAVVEERGTPRPDGRTAIGLKVGEADLVLALGTGKSGLGEDVPQLKLEQPRRGYSVQIIEARFFVDADGRPFAHGQGRLSEEALILDALDAVAPMVPPAKARARENSLVELSAEAEMVGADGGFPGATCRAYVEALRDAVIAGSLAEVARQVPGLARMQAAAGYAWGGRYLAFDDTDVRSGSLPIPGAEACMHENVDLVDDRQRWVLSLTRDGEGRPSRLSVWAHERGSAPTAELVDAAIARGAVALGEPTLTLDLSTGEMGIREGTAAPGTLATNVVNGIERDLKAYRDLKKTFGGIGVEDRTDFGSFMPGDPQEDMDDEAPSPSP